MIGLDTLAGELDALWAIDAAGPDPAMSRHLPRVYDAAGIDWRRWVEPRFAELFNGLMFRGDDTVRRVSGACFPSAAVLDTWLAGAGRGDLLVTHHPIDLRNGHPDGVWAEGFVAIGREHLAGIKDAGVSVYSAHAPMDVSDAVGTTAAIVEGLGGAVEERIWPYGNGHAGVICRVAPTDTDRLAAAVRALFRVERLEIEGAHRDRIERIAIVAGVGDHPDAMADAEARGADAWLTGELHVRIEGDYGRTKYAQVKAFGEGTGMSLLGASHAATEHLVMRTQLARWFAGRVPYATVDEPQWWR
jgi:putative NIF3 family GTP cyclohydrolase 1 type 2